MKNKIKGNLILLLTAIIWGSGFIAQKLGNEVISPMSFNAIRQFMAGLVLLPIMLVSLRKSGYFSNKNSKAVLTYRKSKALRGGIVCGIFMFIGTMTQQIGMMTVSAGKSGFISAVYIVFTPLFSVVLGKKVKFKTFACIAIAMAGFAVMSLKDGLSGSTPGDWWTLISAAGFAAQIVAINYFVDQDNDIVLSVIEMFFCGVVGIAVSLIVEQPTMDSVMAAMPMLLYSTLLPTAAGYTLQIVGQKYTDSTSAALIMSLEAVFAAIFGALILAERMTGRELLGCAIIFAAVLLDQIELKKNARQ